MPYEASSFDVVVLDPAYAHGELLAGLDRCYQNAATNQGAGHAAIVDLYRQGMKEAHRILRKDGLLWVRCQDEIESARQRWTHIELLAVGEEIGFAAKDLFVLTQRSTPPVQVVQGHARKNHGYLWIFTRDTLRPRRPVRGR